MSLDRRTFLKSSALAGGALGIGALGTRADRAFAAIVDPRATREPVPPAPAPLRTWKGVR